MMIYLQLTDNIISVILNNIYFLEVLRASTCLPPAVPVTLLCKGTFVPVAHFETSEGQCPPRSLVSLNVSFEQGRLPMAESYVSSGLMFREGTERLAKLLSIPNTRRETSNAVTTVLSVFLVRLQGKCIPIDLGKLDY